MDGISLLFSVSAVTAKILFAALAILAIVHGRSVPRPTPAREQEPVKPRLAA
jgi:hypothetical protein